MARIGVFHHDDTRVLPKFVVQLVGAAVDRVDFRCAVLQHEVGESAGGRADVEADRSFEMKSEREVRALNFKATAADVTLFFLYEELDVVRIWVPRFVGGLSVDAYLARSDESLRLFAAFGQGALYKKLV